MIRNVEAVYVNGVLRLIHRLPLRENERVWITVDTIDSGRVSADRERATAKFREGAAASRLRTPDTLPTREQLHERG